MTFIRSPVLTSPGSTTRRYAPGRWSRVNAFTQCGSAILAWNVAHGMRPNVGCRTRLSPIRHISPMTPAGDVKKTEAHMRRHAKDAHAAGARIKHVRTFRLARRARAT